MKINYLLALIILINTILLSSCSIAVPNQTYEPESTSDSSLSTTIPVPPTEILSPNDSLELISVYPECGTPLTKGTSVPFTVTVDYVLNAVSVANVRVALGLENGASIGIAPLQTPLTFKPGIEIQKGSGTLAIEGIIDVDTLTQMLQTDKVCLSLDLFYFKSANLTTTIVLHYLEDCCYSIVESSTP